MSVQVRLAEHDDIPWLLTELEKFSKMYSEQVSLFGADEKYRVGTLATYIEKHYVLIAAENCACENEIKMGFLCALHLPHHFNPKITVLSEQFFWVKEEYRGNRAGYLLLQEFKRIGREVADTMTFSRLANSPMKRESLEKMGFSFREESYVLEVGN